MPLTLRMCILMSFLSDVLSKKAAKKEAGVSSKSSVADGVDAKDEETGDDDENIGVKAKSKTRDKLLRAPLFVRDTDEDSKNSSSNPKK